MPRPILWGGTPALAIVLIAIFVFLGFPYDLLSDRIASSAENMTGADITIVDIYPRITVGGPGLGAEIVSVTTATQQHIELGPVGVRPAWSLSWLTGSPALYIEVDSPIGQAEGTVTLGSEMALDAEISNADLSFLPIPPEAAIRLTGIVAAEADLVFEGSTATGPFTFHAESGTITHDALPMPLEFEDFKGDLVLGTDPLAEVKDLTFVGPILTAAIEGNLNGNDGLRSAKLDLDMVVNIKNPAILLLLQGMGIKLDADGNASFAVVGPITRPQIQ